MIGLLFTKLLQKNQLKKRKLFLNSMYKLTITKKYGPIGTIIIKIMQSIPPTDQQPPTDQEQEKLVAIRIKHLALSSCWEMYLENCITLNLDVEGTKLNNILKAWLVVK